MQSKRSKPAIKPIAMLLGEMNEGADQPARRQGSVRSVELAQQWRHAGESDALPSSNLAKMTPVPPAPPKGAMPFRSDEKTTRPFAWRNTLAGILR